MVRLVEAVVAVVCAAAAVAGPSSDARAWMTSPAACDEALVRGGVEANVHIELFIGALTALALEGGERGAVHAARVDAARAAVAACQSDGVAGGSTETRPPLVVFDLGFLRPPRSTPYDTAGDLFDCALDVCAGLEGSAVETCCFAASVGCECAACDPSRRLMDEASMIAVHDEAELRGALSANNSDAVTVTLTARHVEVYDSQVDVRTGKNVVVVAASTASLSAAGGWPHRLFAVEAQASLEVRNLTLAHGLVYGSKIVDLNGRGGCIRVAAGGALKIVRSAFVNCTGAIGGAIGTGPFARLDVVDASFSDCVAFIGGGAIVAPTSSVTIRATTIRDCHSGYSSGAIVLYDGVSPNGGDAMIEATRIFRCTSNYNAGAVSGPAEGTLTFVDSLIANCSTAVAGGALQYFGGTAVSLSNSHITRCAAHSPEASYGGAILGYSRPDLPATCTLSHGSTITHCNSVTFGGAIQGQMDHDIHLEGGSVISGCRSLYGGGIYAARHVEVRDGSAIEQCEAAIGGGLFTQGIGHTLRIADASVVDNFALAHAGAIALSKGYALFVVRSTLSRNVAAGLGGAIASAGGRVWLMAGSILTGNMAASGGAVALRTEWNPFNTGGGANGRLFASGPRCAFVQFLIDLTSSSDAGAAVLTYGVIVDAETRRSVDARGASTTLLPAAGEVNEADLCLKQGRAYRLILASPTGAGWQGPAVSAHLVGPLDSRWWSSLFLSSSSSSSSSLSSSFRSFATPDASMWETRLATHHEFSMEEGGTVGGRPRIAENVALNEGGVVVVGQQARALAVDVDFASNVALGDQGGGVAFLDTSTAFHAEGCTFHRNHAYGGPGGAVHGRADCAGDFEDVAATNNTALGAGGFGHFDGAATVFIQDALFKGNRLDAATMDAKEGGALSLDTVKNASIRHSIFDSNMVPGPRSSGGAVAIRDSVVDFRGVTFQGNAAEAGDGGAVALRGGHVHWPALDEARCTPTDIIVDFTTTTEHCGQFMPDSAGVCDTNPAQCMDLVYHSNANPYVSDRIVSYCAGCSCAWDFYKYFVLSRLVLQEEGETAVEEPVPVFERIKRWDARGTGFSDAIYAYHVCLPGGDYVLRAYDVTEETWFGAEVEVHVRSEPTTTRTTTRTTAEVAAYALPSNWTGLESPPLTFKVPTRTPSRNAMVANAAKHGGGGAVFWSTASTAAEEPAGLLAGAVVFLANDAAYGGDAATDATRLRVRGGGPNASTSREPVAPSISVALLDHYDQVVVSDSRSVIFADANATARWGPLQKHHHHGGNNVVLFATQGNSAIAVRGVATFDQLAFDTRAAVVDVVLTFHAPALPSVEGDGLDRKVLQVRQPETPTENRNKIGPLARGFMIALVAVNLAAAVACLAWTLRYRDRTIVKLSQPKFLICLCLGCVLSSLSSVAPLLAKSTLACGLMLWLYGVGFIITTTTLYTKMQSMNAVIEHSLMMHKIDANNAMIRTDRRQILKVTLIMGTGEVLILLLWALVAPLTYKRSCVQRDRLPTAIVNPDGADTYCTESVGKCRTTHGEVFVTVLALYHILCVLSGMHTCYVVRNLPSIMAEGKWVFTALYSQLQVFVTAVPVLAMVRNDYVSFCVLTSLVICIGDFTTLAMLYVPKMYLVFAYYDLDGSAISSYVSSTLSRTTQRDSIYESLRVRTKRKNGGRPSQLITGGFQRDALDRGGLAQEDTPPGEISLSNVPMLRRHSSLRSSLRSSGWRSTSSTTILMGSQDESKVSDEEDHPDPHRTPVKKKRPPTDQLSFSMSI